MTRAYWQISVAATVVIAATSAAPAAAQSRSQGRVEISANAGALTGTSTFEASRSFSSNGGETATITVDHGAKTAVAFSVGGAVKIVPQFWVGVQYGMSDTKSSASVTAVIPHPILFNTPRTVEGSVDNVAHTEQNVHVELMYALPLHAVDVKVMGGPTFFNVKQDFVSNVSLNETYPFDTATFAGATTKRLSETAVGFNAGVDVSYPLTSKLGIGGLVRYSRADVKFDDAEVGAHTVKAGGVEALGGVRLRF